MSQPPGAVLVTGASSGIGLACSLALAGRGYRVFAGGRHWQGRRNGGLSLPGNMTTIELDITSEDSIRDAVDQLRSELSAGGLVGLVNCAGSGSSGPLEYLSRQSLNELFDVNVTGQLMVIQGVLPMLRAAAGRIVNVGSTSGRIPGAFNGAYSATKFALESLTTVLRAELASSNLSVSMIEPGVVATPFWDKLAAGEASVLGAIPEEGRRRYGPVFARRHARLAGLRSAGQSTDAVCDAILHALCAKRPRRRYVVGTQARIKLAVWGLLPEFLRDRIVRRSLR